MFLSYTNNRYNFRNTVCEIKVIFTPAIWVGELYIHKNIIIHRGYSWKSRKYNIEKNKNLLVCFHVIFNFIWISDNLCKKKGIFALWWNFKIVLLNSNNKIISRPYNFTKNLFNPPVMYKNSNNWTRDMIEHHWERAQLSLRFTDN